MAPESLGRENTIIKSPLSPQIERQGAIIYVTIRRLGYQGTIWQAQKPHQPSPFPGIEKKGSTVR
jgi:hypothetical protein